MKLQILNFIYYLGAGHKAVEEVILDETTDLKSEFSKHEGEPVSVSYKVKL